MGSVHASVAWFSCRVGPTHPAAGRSLARVHAPSQASWGEGSLPCFLSRVVRGDSLPRAQFWGRWEAGSAAEAPMGPALPLRGQPQGLLARRAPQSLWAASERWAGEALVRDRGGLSPARRWE